MRRTLTSAALALALPAAAQEQPSNDREYLNSLGTTAYIVGLCEHHYPASDAEALISRVLDLGQQHLSMSRRRFIGIIDDARAQGRAEAAEKAMGAEMCRRVLAVSLEEIGTPPEP